MLLAHSDDVIGPTAVNQDRVMSPHYTTQNPRHTTNTAMTILETRNGRFGQFFFFNHDDFWHLLR